MTAALTPALALDYVRALSADVRAAVVLDARGAPLAGPAALAAAAREMLAAAGSAGVLEGATDAGAVFAARDDRHAIVAVTGAHALSGLTRHDLRSALAALGGAAAIEGAPAPLREDAVDAVVTAAEDGFPRRRAV